jgi:hypothetical protein
MRKFATALLLAATMACGVFSPRADASAVTYDIFDQLGEFTVTGTVTTDGTTGFIGTSNFLDWDLALNKNGTTVNTLIMGDGSFIIGGGVLDASPTALTFDHAFISARFGITSPSASWYWCVQGIGAGCTGNPMQSSFIKTQFDGTGSAFRRGVFQYGTLAVPAVPEPSTWALMLLGFAGLGYLGYRKSLPRTA